MASPMISSVPNTNKLYGVVTSNTTDTLMGEVSYSPVSWSTANNFEAIIPATAAANFNNGDTVTVMIKATAVSISNYDK